MAKEKQYLRNNETSNYQPRFHVSAASAFYSHCGVPEPASSGTFGTLFCGLILNN